MSKRTLLVAGCALLLLAGCDKVTQANYAKIKSGMPRTEVESILGKPSECSSMLDGTNCYWRSGEAYINISFISDKTFLTVSSGLK